AVTDGKTTAKAEGKVAVRVANRRVVLSPFDVTGPSTRLRLGGDADFAPREGELVPAVTRFDATANGRVEAGLLAPFLAGGAAEGAFALAANVGGTPQAPSGRVDLHGESA